MQYHAIPQNTIKYNTTHKTLGHTFFRKYIKSYGLDSGNTLLELGTIVARVFLNQSVRACDLGKVLLLGVIGTFRVQTPKELIKCIHRLAGIQHFPLKY